MKVNRCACQLLLVTLLVLEIVVAAEEVGPELTEEEDSSHPGIPSDVDQQHGIALFLRPYRRLGSEFLGKRSNGPEIWNDKRALGSEFLGKRRLGSEFLGKRRLGSEFLGKRRMGSEFLGKRRLGSEFLGKRSSIEDGRNSNNNNELLSEPSTGILQMGHQNLPAVSGDLGGGGGAFNFPMELFTSEDKRAAREYWGKRKLGSEFLG